MRVHRSRIAACLSLVLLCGCGGAKPGPEIATVKGTVTLDGTPVDHGMVYFYPDSSQGTTGPTSNAVIDAQGNYTIVSAGDRQGAVIGFHKIRVEIRKPPESERDTEPALLIPAKYNNPSTSGLTAEVKSGIENIVDLPLVSTK